MADRFMVLPSKNSEKIRMINIPSDYEEHEAYRHVTGVIASIEEQIPNYDWDDILESLEEHGFTEVKFILGPEL